VVYLEQICALLIIIIIIITLITLIIRIIDSDTPSFPSISLPDLLCDLSNHIWRNGTPFEAITGRIVPSSDVLLAEVSWDFPQL
jgi:hypothetical protein